MDTKIREELTEFIVANYLFGDTASVPRDDDSLVEEGIIDSTGILELIEFVESHFLVEVSEFETVPENLGSISSLAEFIMSKLSTRERSTCVLRHQSMAKSGAPEDCIRFWDG